MIHGGQSTYLNIFAMSSSVVLREIAVGEEDNFDSRVNSYRQEATTLSLPLYVLVTGAKGANGQSWCPDCVSAEKVLEEKVYANPKAKGLFVVCPVERAKYKGIVPVECEGDQCFRKTASAHPYRSNQLQVKSIPTLYLMDNKLQPVSSLVEADVYDVKKLTTFLGLHGF